MRADEFYLPTLRVELSQGDIVDMCPVGAVPRLRVARARIDSKGQGPEAHGMIYDYPFPGTHKWPPTPPLFRKDPETPIFEARLRRAIVVSNDCVSIAKEGNRQIELGLEPRKREWPLHVVPLQPWPAPTDVASNGMALGELISSGRVHRYLEIPDSQKVPHCYADFRFLTPLKPEIFEGVDRVASLTDGGQAFLWAKVYTYFSARAFPAELACPHCARTFSLAALTPIEAEHES